MHEVSVQVNTLSDIPSFQRQMSHLMLHVCTLFCLKTLNWWWRNYKAVSVMCFSVDPILKTFLIHC